MIKSLLSVAICVIAASTAPIYAQLMISSTQTNIACNGSNDGSITVSPINGTGHYSYSWVPNVGSGPTLTGLGPGTYTLNLIDTISTGAMNVLYQQDFEATHNWNLNVSTGLNDPFNNIFNVSDAEGGVPIGNCGIASNGNKTLHISSSLYGSGAMYNAGGLCTYGICVVSNVRAESPTFSTVGHSNITLEFDYIANGEGLNDNASVWYNAGTGWVELTASIKSAICGGGQGMWTKYTVTLPAACDNNSAVKIGVNWTNNDDGLGTDPSLAIDNVLVFTPGSGTPVTQTASATFVIVESDPIVTNLTVETCDTYSFNGVDFNSTGNYSTVYTSAAGCDSTVNLDLTIHTTPNANITSINNITLSAVGGTQFQWVDCSNNQLVNGANSQIFTAPYNGSFAAIVSNGNQCVDTTACLDIFSVGMQSLSENQINIYPNPVSEVLYLQGVLETHISLVDLFGREIISINSMEQDMVISVLDLNAGVYLIKISSQQTGQILVTRKIVKN